MVSQVKAPEDLYNKWILARSGKLLKKASMSPAMHYGRISSTTGGRFVCNACGEIFVEKDDALTAPCKYEVEYAEVSYRNKAVYDIRLKTPNFGPWNSPMKPNANGHQPDESVSNEPVTGESGMYVNAAEDSSPDDQLKASEESEVFAFKWQTQEDQALMVASLIDEAHASRKLIPELQEALRQAAVYGKEQARQVKEYQEQSQRALGVTVDKDFIKNRGD